MSRYTPEAAAAAIVRAYGMPHGDSLVIAGDIRRAAENYAQAMRLSKAEIANTLALLSRAGVLGLKFPVPYKRNARRYGR